MKPLIVTATLVSSELRICVEGSESGLQITVYDGRDDKGPPLVGTIKLSRQEGYELAQAINKVL